MQDRAVSDRTRNVASQNSAKRSGTNLLAALVLLPLAAACISPTAHAGSKKCQIGRVAELPITMNSLRPLIPAKINGQDAKFILDSGAFYSMISSATASEYKLKLSPGPYGLTVQGIGGTTEVQVATVKDFNLVGVDIKNVEFLVGGSDVGSAGLLGQNLLEKFDVEYDLANGVIRLFKSENCQGAVMAYWLTPGQSYSVMDIDGIDPLHAHTIGRAQVNGQKIRVTFDTGAFTSVLSLRAAEKAGLKPDSNGVVEEGYSTGIGRGQVKTYIGTFASFIVGDSEEIKNAKLRFSDIRLDDTDMLLGADFFISHRIFVANKEHRLFLTYNGGPVFNLSKHAGSTATDNLNGVADRSGSTPSPAAETAAGQQAGDAGAAPKDAAELARHGSALAARHDFVPALADLSRAIELEPLEPEYYFLRANTYEAHGELDLALADFDHVIALKPDFLPAYIPRAEIKLLKQQRAAAIEDLDAVDHLAPKEADLRFNLAEFDERLDRLPAAIEQYGLWIESHPDDSRMARAMSGRCLSSALQNQDLGTALSDCNTALRRTDKSNKNYPYLFADRALVRLRQGDYGKAISDCNDALRIMPDNARALYARAVAEARLNKKSDSDADLQAAKKIASDIAEQYGKFGLGP
jgi:tetratricopeptide (TPR) repeat protein/predicted aspartyl protease